MNDYEQITPHLSTRETLCSCGCGKGTMADMDKRVAIIFEDIRAECSKLLGHDTPIRVSSGFRCEKQNKKAKGTKNSFHLRGMALDLLPPAGLTYSGFAAICERITGDRGAVIKYFDLRCIHIDCREKSPSGKPVRLWL